MKAFQSSISDIYLGSPFREIIILPWKAKKASFKIRGPPNCPSTWFGELSYQQVTPLPHTVYLLHLTLQTCVFRFSAHAHGSVVKNPPTNAGDMGLILGQEDPLEKETATHSSILAWGIPWTGVWQEIVQAVTKSRSLPSDSLFHFHQVT